MTRRWPRSTPWRIFILVTNTNVNTIYGWFAEEVRERDKRHVAEKEAEFERYGGARGRQFLSEVRANELFFCGVVGTRHGR